MTLQCYLNQDDKTNAFYEKVPKRPSTYRVKTYLQTYYVYIEEKRVRVEERRHAFVLSSQHHRKKRYITVPNGIAQYLYGSAPLPIPVFEHFSSIAREENAKLRDMTEKSYDGRVVGKKHPPPRDFGLRYLCFTKKEDYSPATFYEIVESSCPQRYRVRDGANIKEIYFTADALAECIYFDNILFVPYFVQW